MTYAPQGSFSTGVWVFGQTGGNTNALCSDGTYIYAGLNTSPAQVVKIDPTTMATVAVWTGDAASAEEYCWAVVHDGTNLYAGLNPYTNPGVTPAKVVKINPGTMATISVWTGAAGQVWCKALVYAGANLYAGLETLPAQVVKINPATMATVSTWTGAGGGNEDGCYALVYDGTYIYAGTFIHAVQINTGTMATVLAWAGIAGATVTALTYDGSTYIYAGDTEAPAKVTKINPATMATVSTWTGVAGQDYCNSLASDGTYLYGVLLNATPGQLVKISQSTMTTVKTVTGNTGSSSNAVVLAGTYAYANFDTTTLPMVIKYDTSTMIRASRGTLETVLIRRIS